MARKESVEEEALVHHLKKQKRVRFVATDEGVEANKCIKVYLVSSKEQVDSSDVTPVDTVDLNVFFFEEDGKIYGYQDLKITIWINSLSFCVYVDIVFQSSSDKGKGITDLKSALEEILGDYIVEEKDDFLRSFEDEADYISSLVSTGEVLKKKIYPGGDVDSKGLSLVEDASTIEVVHIRLGNNSAGRLYCRLVPLVLLLIDGSNPIDIEDPEWGMFVVMKSTPDTIPFLLGFTTVYRFYHYPDSSRLRLGQILVLPQHQHQGYGRLILETVNAYAEDSESVYDLTMEEPLENLQHLRTCVDTARLLKLPSVLHELDSAVSRIENVGLGGARIKPGRNTAEEVRRRTKINRKQFIQCWDVLVYIRLAAVPGRAESFREWIFERVRADVVERSPGSTGKKVIDVPTQHDQQMSFVMFASGCVGGEADGEEQEEQIRLAVKERLEEIESVAKKVMV